VHCWSSGIRRCAESHEESDRPFPEGALLPEEACAREAHFLDRVTGSIGRAGAIWHPYQRKMVPLDPRLMDSGEEAFGNDRLKKLIRKHHETGLNALYTRMPKNRGTLRRMHQRKLVRKTTIFTFLGLSISPLEELVTTGVARSPMTAESSVPLMERIMEKLRSGPDHYYYVNLFSTTGWTEEALASIPVADDYMVALSQVNNGVWQTFRSGDAQWQRTDELFELGTLKEKEQWIEDFVLAHAANLLLNRMIDRDVASGLALPVDLVSKVFRRLGDQDSHLQCTEGQDGWQLVRSY
jgi:hypothetical protein